MSEERFDLIDQKFTAIDQRFDGVEERLDRLESGQTELRTHIDSKFDELGRHMRVLHEEALERIADTREIPATMGETKPAESKDEIGRRLDPLEALVPVVQGHTAKLERHEAEIERLKRRRK